MQGSYLPVCLFAYLCIYGSIHPSIIIYSMLHKIHLPNLQCINDQRPYILRAAEITQLFLFRSGFCLVICCWIICLVPGMGKEFLLTLLKFAWRECCQLLHLPLLLSPASSSFALRALKAAILNSSVTCVTTGCRKDTSDACSREGPAAVCVTPMGCEVAWK